jgi:hypothetical protein
MHITVYKFRNFWTYCWSISFCIEGILLYVAMMNSGIQQSLYMHKVFPDCYLVAGMEPYSKSGSIFVFDLPSEHQECRAQCGTSMAFLGLQTHCSHWIKCHTVMRFNFLTKTLKGTTEDFI